MVHIRRVINLYFLAQVAYAASGECHSCLSAAAAAFLRAMGLVSASNEPVLRSSGYFMSLLVAYVFFPLVLCFKVHSCTSRRWKYIQDEWCLQDKNTSISHPEFTVTTYCWYIFNKQKSNFSLFQLKVSQNVKAVLSLEQELMADSQPVCWMGVWWDSFCKLL